MGLEEGSEALGRILGGKRSLFFLSSFQFQLKSSQSGKLFPFAPWAYLCSDLFTGWRTEYASLPPSCPASRQGGLCPVLEGCPEGYPFREELLVR